MGFSNLVNLTFPIIASNSKSLDVLYYPTVLGGLI